MVKHSHVYRALSKPRLVMGMPINMVAILWGIAAFTVLMVWASSLLTIWNGPLIIGAAWLVHIIIASQFDKDPIINEVYKVYTTTKNQYHPQSRILDRMHERPSKFGRGVRC